MPLPRLVVTIGVHGSASTWVFNVVRELLQAAAPAERVTGVYAEATQDLLTNPALREGAVVWKLHVGDAGFDGLVWVARAPVVVSIRDPRDAVLSLEDRFGVERRQAVAGIARDCNRMVACAAAGHPVLRYEDRFFDRPDAVAALARFFRLDLPEEVLAGVFERWRTEAVRAQAAGLEALPPERVAGAASDRYDTVTQVHGTHVGDARSGKWRERLDAAERAELTGVFAPFLRRFGYDASA